MLLAAEVPKRLLERDPFQDFPFYHVILHHHSNSFEKKSVLPLEMGTSAQAERTSVCHCIIYSVCRVVL